MSTKKEEMHLPKVTPDEFFTTQEERDSEKLEKIQNISRTRISPFPNHPFKVRDDEKMFEMVESIKEHGVLVPVLIRPKADGDYEMVAGHRRQRGCELAELDEMPCIIRDLTDEQATIIMVDSNLQREQILPSERAFAYKMKLEAMKKQGQRNDLTSSQVATKLDSATKVGGENGESRDTVYRYIRLTYLIPELLQLVDNHYLNLSDKTKMAMLPAVEISYLTEDEQSVLLDTIDCFQVTPSHAQARLMKKRSEEGTLTADKIDEILSQEKANQIPKIKLNEDRFIKILPSHLKNAQEREDYIFHCVEIVRNKELRQQREYAR